MSDRTLQQVYEALAACVDKSGNLHLPPNFLGSTAIAIAWDAFFAGKTFDVDGVTIALHAGDVTVSGAGRGLFDQLAVSATFALAANDIGVTITGTAAGGWSLTNAFPALGSTFFANIPATGGATLILQNAAAAGGGNAAGSLRFAGTLNVARFSPDLASIAGDSLAFSGTIGAAKGVPTFTLTTATSTWSIPIGAGLEISNAHAELGYDGGKTSAKLTATLVLDAQTSLAFDWELPSAMHIVGNFGGSSLMKLAGDLHGSAVSLPASFDVPLPACTLSITKNGAAYAFDVAANDPSIGDAMFSARKGTGSIWAFGFGLDLSGSKLSSLAGLSALSAIEDLIALENVVLVVGSNIDAATAFPDAGQFTAATFPVHRISLPKQAGGLQSGLNVYADVDLAKNAVTKPVVQLIGLGGTLGAALTIPPDPANGTSLTASLSGTTHGVAIAGSLGVLLQGETTALTLKGSATTTIQSQPVTFTVAAAFVANGVFLSGTMQGRVTFGPVTLSNLALEIGVDAEGIPSLGVAGQVDVADFESSIAIFFDSANPSESMFAGSIGDVDLGKVLTTFAGDIGVPIPPAVKSVLGTITIGGTGAFTLPATPLAEALAKHDARGISTAFASASTPATLPTSIDKLFISQGRTAGHWFVTDIGSSPPVHYELRRQGDTFSIVRDAQIYVAPQNTTIGELTFGAGTELNGALSVLGLTGTVQVQVIQNSGLSATATLSKISLPNDNVLVISSADGTSGPLFSVSTYADAAQTDPNLKGPHVCITGKASLLGIVGESVYVDLQSDGFHLTLSSDDGVASISLHVTITSSVGFLASGTATVGIDRTVDLGSVAGVDLGSVSLDATASCALTISATSAGASASFTGSFSFEGEGLTIPTVQLDVTTAALAHLADLVIDAAVSAVKNFLLGDVNKWLNWVNDNVIAGMKNAAEKVGAVLSKVYGQTANQIASLTRNTLGYGADAAAAALNGAGTAANDAASALSSAGYATADIASAIANTFTGIHADVSLGHVDTPGGPHADFATPPHGDGATHADIPGVHDDIALHGDTSGPHGDVNLFIGHGDGAPHLDTPSGGHGDSVFPPHGDGPLHGDTPAGPHSDGPLPPHADTGTHIDTGGSHGDAAPPPPGTTSPPPPPTSTHNDTQSHTDNAGSHDDFAMVNHFSSQPQRHVDHATPHDDAVVHGDTA